MEVARQALSAPGAFNPRADLLRALYTSLRDLHGGQPWWPAQSRFEIVVGAVLTQNTAWANVEKALSRMRSRNLLSLNAVLAHDHAPLAEAIRPSGYYNIKATRLRNLCEFIDAQGGLDGLSVQPLERLRRGLLDVNGIGPETADDILLYALSKPVFVVDTYTRRLLRRQHLARGDEPYDCLRAGFERALDGDVDLYQQYHALIVTHAKAVCRKTPLCQQCALSDACPSSR